MGMPEPFFETKNHQKLVEHEQLVSNVYDGSLEAICCYIQSSIADLSLEHLVSLLNSHQNTVPDMGAKNREWQPSQLLDMIGKGLEKMVGKTTSQLTLEAIKTMYKIDEKIIISQPGLFEKGIKKMFADSAWVILDAIKNEIITGISFDQTSQAQQGTGQTSEGLNFLLCQSCNWSATAVSSWRPAICPVCHNSAISSLPINYPDGNKR